MDSKTKGNCFRYLYGVLIIIGAILYSQTICSAQTIETGKRIVLTDGNELHSWCQAAQDVLKTNGSDEVSVRTTATRDEIIGASKCWAYITGVIESIPAGGAFDPGPDVRLSQYIDVVEAYLRQHPNIRQEPAAFLVRTAVEEAFPHRLHTK
jgi:hypothetical protein